MALRGCLARTAAIRGTAAEPPGQVVRLLTTAWVLGPWVMTAWQGWVMDVLVAGHRLILEGVVWLMCAQRMAKVPVP